MVSKRCVSLKPNFFLSCPFAIRVKQIKTKIKHYAKIGSVRNKMCVLIGITPYFNDHVVVCEMITFKVNVFCRNTLYKVCVYT